jgi:hypothetical protein
MRRPPRLRIRIRKPWVFFLLRTFGWYVLFTYVPRLVDGEPPAKNRVLRLVALEYIGQ